MVFFSSLDVNSKLYQVQWCTLINLSHVRKAPDSKLVGLYEYIILYKYSKQ